MSTPDSARTAWFITAARGLAAARGGSLARKAALCCAVALEGSRSPAGARKVLADARPDHVREAAMRLLDHLTQERPAR